VTHGTCAEPHARLLGVLLVLLSAVAFGSGPFFARAAYDTGMVALPILFWRFLFAAAVAWALVAAVGADRRSLWRLGRRRVAVLVALGIIYSGNSGTYVAGLATVPASLSAMIVYLYPALVAVLSARFARRLEGRRAWLALGLSTLGVMLAVGGIPEGEAPPLSGLLLIVASPTIYACWIILAARLSGERPSARDIPPGDAEAPPEGPDSGPATALLTTATAATFGTLLLVSGGTASPSDVPSGAWLALAGFGLFSAVAVRSFYAGARRIGAARAALVSTVEPVYTIAVATLFFGETLTWVQLLGGALVIGGVLLAETPGPAPGARPEPAPEAEPAGARQALG
jgi:drug/metabolite transporter (DMT)-like permease